MIFTASPKFAKKIQKFSVKNGGFLWTELPRDGMIGILFPYVSIFRKRKFFGGHFELGGELGSTGYRKFKLRVVVGQQAT